MPTSLNNLSSLVKVGVVTFCGAFLAAVSMTTFPTTIEQAKTLLLPALGAAVAAEILFLRGQIAQLLAGQGVQQLPEVVAPAIVAPPAPVAVKLEVKS